jgi:two-component system sensor histidine kinase MprB
MSLATRVSLLAACAVGIAVAVASLAAYVTLRSQLHHKLDESLLDRANRVSRVDITNDLELIYSSELLRASDVQFYFFPVYGPPRAETGSYNILPLTHSEKLVWRGKLNHSFRTIDEGGTDWRAVMAHRPAGGAIMITQSQESIESTIDRVGLVLLFVGGLGIISAALIGLAVARSSLQPVRRLSAAAEHIAQTGDLTPIPVTGDDELARLATSFNGMLTALQRARMREKQLIVDAGHELRTPLTSLRTNLELLAQADRMGGMRESARQEIFADVTAQVEELSTLVGDLVELARDEPLEQTPEPLDMADIVARAVDRVRRRAPSVVFETHAPPWWVVGEAQILERAVLNLLDNAAKWSPPGGTVRVVLNRGELTVIDDGPGVAEADLPLIFERFYRASDARTMPGSGLGLAIVKQAAERHGGTVRASNHPPHGASFVLTLPGTPYRPTQQPPARQPRGEPGGWFGPGVDGPPRPPAAGVPPWSTHAAPAYREGRDSAATERPPRGVDPAEAPPATGDSAEEARSR